MTAGAEQLRRELALQGIGVKILEGDRSAERQAELYAQGRSRPGAIVTRARPWESAHQWGLALDVVPVPDTAVNWKILRSTARALGFGLLGEWDPGHLEHPQWPRVLVAVRKWMRR